MCFVAEKRVLRENQCWAVRYEVSTIVGSGVAMRLGCFYCQAGRVPATSAESGENVNTVHGCKKGMCRKEGTEARVQDLSLACRTKIWAANVTPSKMEQFFWVCFSGGCSTGRYKVLVPVERNIRECCTLGASVSAHVLSAEVSMIISQAV